MEAIACARTIKAIALAIALPLLSGCAGLHLDQEPAVWWSFGLSMLVLALIMRKG